MHRSDETEKSGMGDSFWTSYSDLFVGMSVIFLVLFFFATLRAGVLQMKAAVDSQKQEEYLKGQVPKEVADKSERQHDLVKRTLADIRQKKDELSQLSKTLEDQQTLFDDVLKEQTEKAAQLKSAYDVNQKLELNVKELEALKASLRENIKQKDTAITGLNQKIQNLEDAKTAWQKTFQELNTQLKSRDDQIGQKQHTIEELTKSLDTQAKAVESARTALETEQAKSTRLKSEIEEHARELKRTLSDLNSARSEIAGLQNEVTGREHQISKLKGDVQTAQTEIVGLKSDLTGRNTEITGLKGQVDGLKHDVAKRDGSILKLNGDLAEALRQIGGLKSDIDGRDTQIAQLKGDVKGLQSGISEREARLNDLKKELGLAGSRIAGLTDDVAARNGQINKLKGVIAGIQKELGGKNADLARVRGELAAAKAELGGLGGELSSRDKQIGKLRGEIEDLEGQLAGRDGTLGKLKGQLVDAERELGGLKDELARAKHALTDAKGDDVDKNRKIASLGDELKKAKDEISELAKVRREIAGGVLKNLRANGVDVQVDPESGIMTLSMDEVFRFRNGSYEIGDESKAKIRKIMPVYADSLLGTPERAAKIAGIVITGHASPRYKKKYIDPRAYDRKAYVFNLDLSMKRAQQVAAFIFGDEIGGYPHKAELREKTSVAGKGYMEPVLRGEDGDRSEPCGPYDCPKSRRVEVNFILKENKPKALAQAAPEAPPAESIPAADPATGLSKTVVVPQGNDEYLIHERKADNTVRMPAAVQSEPQPQPQPQSQSSVATPVVQQSVGDPIYGPPVPSWFVPTPQVESQEMNNATH